MKDEQLCQQGDQQSQTSHLQMGKLGAVAAPFLTPYFLPYSFLPPSGLWVVVYARMSFCPLVYLASPCASIKTHPNSPFCFEAVTDLLLSPTHREQSHASPSGPPKQHNPHVCS